jgi:hypothetical protein
VAILSLDPRLVHPLPPTPTFVGREEELEALRRFWNAGAPGVLALVGLGGAGKTAVTARFLEELLTSDRLPRPDGLFVWSFYQEPDAGLFLREAYHYFSRGASPATPAKGTGLLHLLRDGLAVGGPHLLVLDGLEKVQRQESASTGDFGQIEDPLLKGLLLRVAEGIGRTAVLITSRFPLTDLHNVRGQTYHYLDVGGLSFPAAFALLRARGVHGDDAALAQLVEAYGAHALTLDHLGGLIGRFLDGDPARAPKVLAQVSPGGDRQGKRLARLLRAYEEHLPPAELTLLSQLCLLRRSVKEEQILQWFLCSPAVHARTVREIGASVLHFMECVRFLVGKRQELANSIQETIQEALCAAPIAGPEETFRQEVQTAVETLVGLDEQSIGVNSEELACLYADPSLDVPTDLRPLSASDRELLRRYCARYFELRGNSYLYSQNPSPLLEGAFWQTGMGKRQQPRADDSDPSNALELLSNVSLQLRRLTYKHFALRRVRQLCRFYQQRWTLAGPLAQLNSAELHQVLDSLVGRNLVLREAPDSYSVHPAVRDHFSRRSAASVQGAWHDLLREQMLSLAQRPGKRLPEDPATLDLAEEAIYHALQAGRTEEAVGLYQYLLGGLRHLAWKLGEMNRGLRILREFRPCPDCWALAWFLRALGEFEEAYTQNNLPSFRADIRLLQGRLPEVARERDSARSATAEFLMGRTTKPPPDLLGCAIPRDQVLLYLGRHAQLGRSARSNRFITISATKATEPAASCCWRRWRAVKRTRTFAESISTPLPRGSCTPGRWNICACCTCCGRGLHECTGIMKPPSGQWTKVSTWPAGVG